MQTVCNVLLTLSLLAPQALGKPSADKPLDDLTSRLASKDPFDRVEAARQIGDLKPDDTAVIQALISLLKDRNVAEERSTPIPASMRTVSDFASDSLVEIGTPAVGLLADALSGLTEEHSRRRALDTLRRLGEKAKPASSQVLPYLEDRVESVRIHAVHTLAAIETDKTALVAKLREKLRDESPNVRAAALQEIGSTRGFGSPAVTDVITMLDDASLRWKAVTPDMTYQMPTRLDAIEALRRIGPPAHPAQNHLRRIMASDPEDSARIAAAHALVRIQNDQEAFGVLVRYLTSRGNQPSNLIEALDSMKELGSVAAPALPELLLVAQSDDPDARVAAAEALAVVDPISSEARLVEMATDPNEHVREAAVSALGCVPTPSSATISALMDALGDREALWAPEYAAKSLGRLGKHASPALPKLRRFLDSEDIGDEERLAAQKAIEAIRLSLRDDRSNQDAD